LFGWVVVLVVEWDWDVLVDVVCYCLGVDVFEDVLVELDYVGLL